MYLPTTKKELRQLSWDAADIILISGDTYIDSPYIGIAVIGKYLTKLGFRVAVIAQPSLDDAGDITRLGEPVLFWGVSGGSVDSMVANHTASMKKRRNDDYTPGGENNRRPDRAVLVYTNLIRRHFKNTRPIVLGGIEASLRRIAHYDFWSSKIRKSILFDAKADYLVYGMGEKTIGELAKTLKQEKSPEDIRGLCYISSEKKVDSLELPSFDEVKADDGAFARMFQIYFDNSEPETARTLVQRHGDRFLVQNPPAPRPAISELDEIYDMEFERNVHPYYLRQGKVKAMETIGFSITTHRGCFGQCSYCSISMHQGRQVISRSERSVLREAGQISSLAGFKGYISDAGGPTANMYGMQCGNKKISGTCKNRKCLFPKICQHLKINHKGHSILLNKISRLPNVKKVFIASGIRHDLILHDKQYGAEYLKQLTEKHISGQMKIAPEHTEDRVLKLMGKPDKKCLLQFKKLFDEMTKRAGKKQFLTYYIIAAHPGCTESDMRSLKAFADRDLKVTPEQVQIFIPLPSTWSAVMYHTGRDPYSGEKLFVEKDRGKRELQKKLIVSVENKYKRK
ncbi:MAG: YgiQ family radical SAM protein [Nitrospira sp.]|nr:YgiQ family radical SAM protein [Nitrospira sp.]